MLPTTSADTTAAAWLDRWDSFAYGEYTGLRHAMFHGGTIPAQRYANNSMLLDELRRMRGERNRYPTFTTAFLA